MDRYEAHWIGVNRKRSEQSTNTDQKLLETVFSIAIYRKTGYKRQSKILFLLTIFYLLSSIVSTFSIAAYPARVQRLRTKFEPPVSPGIIRKGESKDNFAHIRGLVPKSLIF